VAVAGRKRDNAMRRLHDQTKVMATACGWREGRVSVWQLELNGEITMEEWAKKGSGDRRRGCLKSRLCRFAENQVLPRP